MKKIKYYCIKLKKYLRSNDYYKIIDDRENKARIIALNLVENDKSILKYCTSTGRRYIINDNIVIVIKNESIDFISNTLHTITFSKKNYMLILNGFDKKLHDDIEVLEKRIKHTVYTSFVNTFIDLREE